MDGPRFIEILRTTLLPFISEKYPGGHRLMQDNDPKHRCRIAQSFYTENNINWWKTPAESPDLNPIENMWHELKEYMRSEVKPRTKEKLIQGIQQFWKTVDIGKCTRLASIKWNLLELRHIGVLHLCISWSPYNLW